MTTETSALKNGRNHPCIVKKKVMTVNLSYCQLIIGCQTKKMSTNVYNRKLVRCLYDSMGCCGT